MKFAASVKKVIAFLLCLALLTSDVTVTNATSVDTTDVFTEISTEMLNETKNAGQEENVSEADSDSNAADLSDTESNVSGQYKQSSDSDGTGDTEKVKNTESTEATEAIEETASFLLAQPLKSLEIWAFFKNLKTIKQLYNHA